MKDYVDQTESILQKPASSQRLNKIESKKNETGAIWTFLSENTKTIWLIIILVMLLYLFSLLYSSQHIVASLTKQDRDKFNTFDIKSKPKTHYETIKVTMIESVDMKEKKVREQLEDILLGNKPNYVDLIKLQNAINDQKKSIIKKYDQNAEKVKFFQQKSTFEGFSSLQYIKYNMQTNNKTLSNSKISDSVQEYQRIKNKFKIDQLTSEMPICIVVYCTKIQKKNAYEYLLTSIFNQNYTNFKIVLAIDGLGETQLNNLKTILHYFNQSKIQLFQNTGKGYWSSIKTAVQNHCQNAEIVLLINSKDQMLGFHVLSEFNSVYQRQEANVAYSNFIEYHEDNFQLFRGFSSSYDEKQKKEYRFRNSSIRFGSLLSFRKVLFSFIKVDKILPLDDYVLNIEVEMALFFYLLELSCGKISYINEDNCLFYGYKYEPGKSKHLNQTIQDLNKVEKLKCYKFI